MGDSDFYFIQQLLNGLTIGSTYALIAIGYTMVYGIFVFLIVYPTFTT